MSLKDDAVEAFWAELKRQCNFVRFGPYIDKKHKIIDGRINDDLVVEKTVENYKAVIDWLAQQLAESNEALCEEVGCKLQCDKEKLIAQAIEVTKEPVKS